MPLALAFADSGRISLHQSSDNVTAGAAIMKHDSTSPASLRRQTGRWNRQEKSKPLDRGGGPGTTYKGGTARKTSGGGRALWLSSLSLEPAASGAGLSTLGGTAPAIGVSPRFTPKKKHNTCHVSMIHVTELYTEQIRSKKCYPGASSCAEGEITRTATES